MKETRMYLELLGITHESNIELVNELNSCFHIWKRVHQGVLEEVRVWRRRVIVRSICTRRSLCGPCDFWRSWNETSPSEREASTWTNLYKSSTSICGNWEAIYWP